MIEKHKGLLSETDAHGNTVSIISPETFVGKGGRIVKEINKNGGEDTREEIGLYAHTFTTAAAKLYRCFMSRVSEAT